MAVKTSGVSLSYAVESSTPGVLPGSPIWKLVEPEDIGAFGATISTTARNPISTKRMAQKGAVTDLDSSVEFSCDMTISAFKDFIQGFMMASWNAQGSFDPTAVTATGYTVASGGALTTSTLIYARGFSTSANNGLKVVGASSTATEIKTSGLTAETTPPAASHVDVVGFQGASGDIVINANLHLASTSLDFTTLGLTVGQYIKIGGSTTATKFATAADNGYARIRSIAAHLIELDKRSATFVADAGASKTIQIFYGWFIKNVPLTDADFLEESYQFEATYEGLDSGVATYEYATGNFVNSVTLNLPLASKAGMSLNFIGLNAEELTTTKKSGATASPYETDALNTSSDIARISLANTSEVDVTTYFKSLDITISNAISPEKVLGSLGAAFMNYGDFMVTGSAQCLFTDLAVVNAVRNNTTVSLDVLLSNDDGAIYMNIPGMVLGSGTKSFPKNETVKVDISSEAFEDEFFGFCLGFTYFPYLPA